MPRSPTPLRELEPPFRKFVDDRAGWPPLKQFPRVLEAMGGGRKADIVRMKGGGAVPVKFIRALIELLEGGPILGGYWAGHHAGRPMPDSPGEWLDALSREAPAGGEAGDRGSNWFERGTSGLVDLFTGYVWGPMLGAEMICRSEAEVSHSVEMCFGTVGQHLASSKGGGEPAEGPIALAERQMRIPLGDYRRRALSWWKFQDRTILFATVDRVRVGCSIVLPVTRDAFERILRGELIPYDCTPDQLQYPSNFLVIESLADRCDHDCRAPIRKTAQQVRTLFYQVACLSPRPGLPGDPASQIIAFAGTPETQERLRRFGFARTGNRLPQLGLDIMLMDERKAWIIPAVISQIRKRLDPG